MTLRIAFVTDIHNGADFGAKKGTQALALLEGFVDAAIAFKADYIVTGGDDISSRDPETDKKNKEAVAQSFNRAACPVIKVDGNHCGRFQERQSPSQIIDTGSHQLITWNPYLNRYTGEGVIPDPQDITWLEISLTAATKPIILFSHIPLRGPASKKKWKQQTSDEIYYPSHFAEAEKLQNIIESSGKVILCKSGHRHMNYMTEVNGVYYGIHQSLVEMVDGQPSSAWSMMEFDDNEIRIHGHGHKQPKKVVLPVNRPAKLTAA